MHFTAVVDFSTISFFLKYLKKNIGLNKVSGAVHCIVISCLYIYMCVCVRMGFIALFQA